MTPLGLWRIGTWPTFWLRLPDDPVLLLALAAGVGALVVAIVRVESGLRGVLVWQKGPIGPAIGGGLGGAALVAAPVVVLALSSDVPLIARGGSVPASHLVPLAVFALVGNLYEELLFRGYVQGALERSVGTPRAILLSGLAFSLGHIFLATTVTGAGWPVLAFTAYEGWIAAALRARFGLVAATVAHGGGIFLIASGLY